MNHEASTRSSPHSIIARKQPARIPPLLHLPQPPQTLSIPRRLPLIPVRITHIHREGRPPARRSQHAAHPPPKRISRVDSQRIRKLDVEMHVRERVTAGKGGAVRRNGVNDGVGQTVEGERGAAEGGLGAEGGVHVICDAGEGGGVDVVEVEGVDGVVVAFCAGGAVEGEAGGGFEGGVGDLGDVVAGGVEGEEGVEVLLGGGRGADVDEVEEDEGLQGGRGR